MSIKLKLTLIGALLLVAAVVYYFYRKNSAGAAGSSTDSSPLSDPNDNVTVQRMIAAVQASQFKDDLQYLLSSYPSYKDGGPNAVYNDYGTININGKQVIPNSSAFCTTVWNAWSGTYTTNPQPGTNPPAAGKTQDQATAAAQLCQQIASLWAGYKTEYMQTHL